MVITSHILAGAAIGAKTQNLGLIIILSFLIHALLDRIPHWDYNIQGIESFEKTKKIKPLIIDFIKMGIDGFIGLTIVIIAVSCGGVFEPKYLLYILAGMLFSVLPDIVLGFSIMFAPKKMKSYIKFHKNLHGPEHKKKKGKITFLGLATQVIVIMFSVFLLSL